MTVEDLEGFRTSSIGTIVHIGNSDVARFPFGVLVSTCATKTERATSGSSTSISVHTVYLTDEQFFGVKS